MTELKEELKIGADEGPVEYAERAEAVRERHCRETGERLSTSSTMPGEGPGEVLERIKAIKEADAIRGAGRTRRRERADKTDANQERKGGMTATEESTRRFRVRSQERDVEKAVSEFEAKKKRLYRSDGSKVYGEAEHAERLGELTEQLREKVEAVATEATEDAERYDRESPVALLRGPRGGCPGFGKGASSDLQSVREGGLRGHARAGAHRADLRRVRGL